MHCCGLVVHHHGVTEISVPLEDRVLVLYGAQKVPTPPPDARTAAPHMALIPAEAARVVIAVYGVAIGGGGIGAFFKSGSKPSLVSGVVAGVVLGAAYFKDSVPVALGTAVALSVVFAIRFAKTKKVVPAGVLGIVSAVAAGFFAAAMFV